MSRPPPTMRSWKASLALGVEARRPAKLAQPLAGMMPMSPCGCGGASEPCTRPESGVPGKLEMGKLPCPVVAAGGASQRDEQKPEKKKCRHWTAGATS